MQARTLLRTDQVSETYGIPEGTLRYWASRRRGEGPRSFKLGRRRVYDAADCEEWIEAQYAKAAKEPA